MNLFQNAKFFTTVNHLKDLPETLMEVAFVGRSNAGKSSAINALCNHVRLAYVSKTPGRTQHINFFELNNGGFMVDLPGYGYAQVPEAIRTHWVKLLGDYLRTRTQQQNRNHAHHNTHFHYLYPSFFQENGKDTTGRNKQKVLIENFYYHCASQNA